MCCKRHQKWLCYEETPADDCPMFQQTDVCRNVTSYVGMFRCSICGHLCIEDRVKDDCPNCGRAIHGALWEGQRHYHVRGNQ